MVPGAPDLPKRFSGTLWFDAFEDVPLINTNPGLDLFDFKLLTVPSEQTVQGSWDPQAALQAGGGASSRGEVQAATGPQDGEGASGPNKGAVAVVAEEEEEEPAKPKAAKPKKKALSRAEKARIEREKNREIQARYRARQKERRATLTSQYEEATSDLQRLRAENEQLSHRRTLMENIMNVRDAAADILEAAQEAAPQPQQPARYDLRDGSFWGGSPRAEGPSSYQGCQAILRELAEGEECPTPSGASNPGTSGESWGAFAAAPSGGQASSGGGGGGEEEEWGGGGAAAGVQLAPRASGEMEEWRQGGARIGPVTVPPEVIAKAKSFTPEEYSANWVEFAGRLRDMLAQYDLTKNPRALEELEPIMKRRAVVMTLMLHHNPACLKSLMARSGERAFSNPVQEQQYWDALVAGMQITPVQRERYRHLWSSYLRKMDRLRASRNDALSLLVQMASQDNLLQSGAGGLSGMMSQYLQMLEGASSLSAYPDSQFVALLELLGESGRILSPLQKARMASWSHPYFPDILQVMQAIVRLPGPPLAGVAGTDETTDEAMRVEGARLTP